MNKLKMVKVDEDYCNFLRKYDSKIIYNTKGKENRPFVGILFEVNQFKYFAPLTSPKVKHLTMKNTIDFMKINKGNYGAINFNNMIPLIENTYTVIELNRKITDLEKLKYQKLLVEQYLWLNSRYIQICQRAEKLYKYYYKNRLPESVKERCCNFKLLEEKSIEYKKENILIKT